MFIVLMVLGVGLLAYGLRAQAPVASSGAPGEVVQTSEMAVTQEVAVGGVKRDESGQITKTYEEGQKAPAACPT